jgi:predicted TIM-barrel fold metal-dependent hydrolase
MKIIDSHVHFWDTEKLRYEWLKTLPALNRPFLTDHVPARVGDVDVDGIVFVQANCADEQGLEEVDFVSALAAKDARVRGIVAFAPLEQPEKIGPYLEELKTRPLVKGVRRLIQDEPLGFCTQPKFIAGVQALAAYNYTFDICIRHWQLSDAIQLVRSCPQIHFVLDHIGKPDIKHQLRDPWRKQISELAGLKNVGCKISGLVSEADIKAWAPQHLQPYIEFVVAAFGSERIMFGSDAPVEYLASTYARWIETLRAATSKLPIAAQEKLWYTNAQEFYRL